MDKATTDPTTTPIVLITHDVDLKPDQVDRESVECSEAMTSSTSDGSPDSDSTSFEVPMHSIDINQLRSKVKHSNVLDHHLQRVDSRSTAVEDLEKQSNPSNSSIQTPSSSSSNPKAENDILSKPENQNTLLNLIKGYVLDFQTWFTPYRQLFFLVTVTNLSLLIGIELGQIGGGWEQDFSIYIILHILIAIGIRNEWILRFLYWITIKSFRSIKIPVRFRKYLVGILYHIGMSLFHISIISSHPTFKSNQLMGVFFFLFSSGGLHSGCGVASLFWLILSAQRHFRHHQLYHPAVLTLLSISITCILITCITATPWFRGPRHESVLI